MTDIIADDDGLPKHLLIPTERIPPAAWQAIYYHLSKKVEVNRKLYVGAFEVDKNKIVDLVHRLSQSIIGYSPQAEKVEISISLRNDTSEQLSSLEKFIATDVSHKGSATKSIAIDFDFIICPATELKGTTNPPQKFKVFMLIDQDFFSDPNPENAGFFPDGVAGKNILRIIEYSDYAIARTLQGVVDEWVATLPKREINKLLKFLPNSIKAFRGSLPTYGASIALIPYIYMRFSDPINSMEATTTIIKAMIIALFSFSFLKMFFGWSLQTIAIIQPTTYLLITSGDSERKDKIQRDISKRSAVFYILFTAIIIGFIVGTTSSLFSTYIMQLELW